MDSILILRCKLLSGNFDNSEKPKNDGFAIFYRNHMEQKKTITISFHSAIYNSVGTDMVAGKVLHEVVLSRPDLSKFLKDTGKKYTFEIVEEGKTTARFRLYSEQEYIEMLEKMNNWSGSGYMSQVVKAASSAETNIDPPPKNLKLDPK